MKRLNDLQDVNSDIEPLWPEPGANRAEKVPVAMVAAGAESEAARLQESLEEQDAMLRKASKRIERLLGEKSQLKSLLDKRDHEIQQLNRELGGHASGRRLLKTRNAASSSETPRPPALLTSVGERIRAIFVREQYPAENAAVSRETEMSQKGEFQPLIARQQNGSVQQIIIAVLLGLDKEEIERLLPIIERDCASKGMTPLFLIDMDAFEMLRSRDLIFEYLPPVDDRDRFDPSLHWDLYIQRRLALIRRKWDPVRVVAFGAPAMKTLKLWCSSPFEDAPLPAISGEIEQSR